MLERIGELARNLVVIIFVATLLEMLIPQGSFSRYLRLVTGLLVILLVVTFIGTLVNRIPGQISLVPVTAAAGKQDGTLEQGDRLWQLNRQQAVTVYRTALTKLIEEEIRDHEGVIPVSINLQIEEDQTNPLFGSIYQAVIKITSAPETVSSAEGSIRIEPVKIGSDANPGNWSEQRVPELESALARRLELSPGQIEVWKGN